MTNPEDMLSQRLELWNNATERRQVDERANLYAIILSMEHLEQAYANDAMKASDYHEHCKRLISQFRLASAHLMRDGDESLETNAAAVPYWWFLQALRHPMTMIVA